MTFPDSDHQRDRGCLKEQAQSTSQPTATGWIGGVRKVTAFARVVSWSCVRMLDVKRPAQLLKTAVSRWRSHRRWFEESFRAKQREPDVEDPVLLVRNVKPERGC